MIDGLSHVTFVVSDLQRMTRFLKAIFDADEVWTADRRHVADFLLAPHP